MRVVVTPDKFTSSLTAVGAAEAIGEGLRQGRPGVDRERCQRDASTLLVSLARRLAETSPQFHAAAERQESGDKPTPADSTQSY